MPSVERRCHFLSQKASATDDFSGEMDAKDEDRPVIARPVASRPFSKFRSFTEFLTDAIHASPPALDVEMPVPIKPKITRLTTSAKCSSVDDFLSMVSCRPWLLPSLSKGHDLHGALMTWVKNRFRMEIPPQRCLIPAVTTRSDPRDQMEISISYTSQLQSSSPGAPFYWRIWLV